MKELHFIAFDSYCRAVYKDDNDIYWKTSETVDMRLLANHKYIKHLGLYSTVDNTLEGEPNQLLDENVDIFIHYDI